jgi:hypothetical protein
MDECGSFPIYGTEIFILCNASIMGLGPCVVVSGYRGFVLPRSSRRALQLTACLHSAEAKDAWSYNFAPLYAPAVFCSMKHRDNLAFRSSRQYLWKIARQVLTVFSPLKSSACLCTARFNI